MLVGKCILIGMTFQVLGFMIYCHNGAKVNPCSAWASEPSLLHFFWNKLAAKFLNKSSALHRNDYDLK